MSTPERPQYDDRLVVEYLLGAVPEAEANSLDELSIADDDFAARLSSIENDLVDAYVRGELTGADSERFRSHYLASPVRREKVRFAEVLAAAADRAAAVSSVPAPAKRRGWLHPVPLLAAAACLLLLVVGAALYQNGQLRTQIARIRQESDAQQARERSLQQQIDSRPPAPATPVERPSHLAVGFVLMPQTRSIDPPATLALASDADTVNLQLQLEDGSFPAYRVTLKDAASDRSLWRSDPLPPQTRGTIKVVQVSLPATALTSRVYSLELTGVTAGGAGVSLGGYILRIVR